MKNDYSYKCEDLTSEQLCKLIKSKKPLLQRKAVECLFARLKKPVEKLAFDFKLDKVDAADAMQESAKSVWNRLMVMKKEFEKEGGVFAYSYVVSKNFLIKRAKNRNIELPTAPLTSDYDTENTKSPFHRIAEDDQIEDERIFKDERIVNLLRKLDKKEGAIYGKIFIMRVLKDMKYKQIAEELYLKEATVRKRASRLKKKLRDILGDAADDIL